MVSAERILELEHLSREKEFRAPYDEEVGLRKELEAEERGEAFH